MLTRAPHRALHYHVRSSLQHSERSIKDEVVRFQEMVQGQVLLLLLMQSNNHDGMRRMTTSREV
jgi:hypothetical protein